MDQEQLAQVEDEDEENEKWNEEWNEQDEEWNKSEQTKAILILAVAMDESPRSVGWTD